jgi:hypothetical protein
MIGKALIYSFFNPNPTCSQLAISLRIGLLSYLAHPVLHNIAQASKTTNLQGNGAAVAGVAGAADSS